MRRRRFFVSADLRRHGLKGWHSLENAIEGVDIRSLPGEGK